MKIVKGKRNEVVRNITEIIASDIRGVIKKKGNAIIGLPGGNSIKGILAGLREENIPWEYVDIFMADERWVDLESEESNFRILKEYLLDHIDIPEEKIHPFDYRKGVENYNEEFNEYGGRFDVLLLGAGEDCHVGSLFPNHKALKEDKKGYILVDNSPKPPSKRVSVSKSSIKDANMSILIFFGEVKREAMEEFLSDEKTKEECPAKFALESKSCYVVTDL